MKKLLKGATIKSKHIDGYTDQKDQGIYADVSLSMRVETAEEAHRWLRAVEMAVRGLDMVDGKLQSDVTYEELQEEGMTFLAHCGELTMVEQASSHNPAGKTSANEILGMATRVIAGEALKIQMIADTEEKL